MKIHVLIADDSNEDAAELASHLQDLGATVTVLNDGVKALKAVRDGEIDVLVSETVLHSLGGKELTFQVLAENPTFPILVRTRFPRLEDAFDLARLGVLSYSIKGDDIEKFAKEIINCASGYPSSIAGDSSEAVEKLPFSQYKSRNIETSSVYRLAIEKVARAPSTVLITGESGTGKELLARTIHNHGPRSNGPWVAVNCAALPESLIESELFGHEKGAFTGASSRRVGRFEQANGGTFFLDEIGDLTPVIQTKLLRVLQEKTIERVGGSNVLKVDVRVIAATHRNLKQLVKKGVFREDLFYRISVIGLNLPPLRKRLEDIPGLAQFFMERFRKQAGREEMALTPRAIKALQRYRWPGNVRELENVIERGVVLAPRSRINLEDLPEEIVLAGADNGEEKLSLKEARAEFEQKFITEALQKYGGNVSATAKSLDIARKNLQEKIKTYKINVDALRRINKSESA